MKKNYIKPEIEISIFQSEDIITSSSASQFPTYNLIKADWHAGEQAWNDEWNVTE